MKNYCCPIRFTLIPVVISPGEGISYLSIFKQAIMTVTYNV